jgi:PKD repeat protein
VTNAGGSSTKSELDYIMVNEAEPIVSFTADVTSGHPVLAVQFTDTSSNAPTSWYWYFGDGGSSDEQNPVHEFEEAGTYTVAFTATNDAGSNTTTEAKYITVITIDPPEPSFVADITSGTVPLLVSFTDMSTNSPTSWDWNFGDGSTSELQHPTHQYTSAGTYTVILTSGNDSGSRTTTSSHYIVVNAIEETMTAVVPESSVTTEVTAEPSDTDSATALSESSQASAGGSWLSALAIIAVLLFGGIGTIVFILRNRSGHRASHSRKREL